MKIALNIQSIIFGLLGCLVVLLAFLIVLVGFAGILRIAVISVFEFDFVKWFKKRKNMYKLNLKRSEDEKKILD